MDLEVFGQYAVTAVLLGNTETAVKIQQVWENAGVQQVDANGGFQGVVVLTSIQLASVNVCLVIKAPLFKSLLCIVLDFHIDLAAGAVFCQNIHHGFLVQHTVLEIEGIPDFQVNH